MQNYRECFEKVRKDCVKYIQSQETKKEKFKNKDQMIKSHIIPLCFWINKKRKDKKTLFVGLAGGQGTGKTTISTLLRLVLVKYFKLQVFKISIDDFYKTRKERILLSKSKHPLLLTRGVPGTHDIQLMVNLFKKVKKSTFRSINIPKFDKSVDDRCKKNSWFKLKKKPDILILEGWCVGARAEGSRSLNRPINVLEKNADKKKIWRSYVNNQLKSKYSKLFDQLDSLLYLKAKNFKWPEYDTTMLKEETINVVIQINGKKRGLIQTKPDITEEKLFEIIKNDEKIMKYFDQKKIKKKIYIKDKLLNIII